MTRRGRRILALMTKASYAFLFYGTLGYHERRISQRKVEVLDLKQNSRKSAVACASLVSSRITQRSAASFLFRWNSSPPCFSCIMSAPRRDAGLGSGTTCRNGFASVSLQVLIKTKWLSNADQTFPAKPTNRTEMTYYSLPWDLFNEAHSCFAHLGVNSFRIITF